jgi:hypothetical protein
MGKIANQDSDRITRSAEAALVKRALAGDSKALDTLLRRAHASQRQPLPEIEVPQVFQGKKQVVFELIAQGHTNRSAARIADCSEVTVCRYKNDPQWREALGAVKRQRVRLAAKGLSELLPLSIQRIRTVLSDPSASHRDLLKAAEMVMDRAGIPRFERLELSGAVESPGSVTVDPSERLAALLAGGGE